MVPSLVVKSLAVLSVLVAPVELVRALAASEVLCMVLSPVVRSIASAALSLVEARQGSVASACARVSLLADSKTGGTAVVPYTHQGPHQPLLAAADEVERGTGGDELEEFLHRPAPSLDGHPVEAAAVGLPVEEHPGSEHAGENRGGDSDEQRDGEAPNRA